VEDEMHKMTKTFPKGTYIIRTGQATGRIICHMLEPETTDNVITWNTMDAILPRIRSSQSNRAGGRPAAGAGNAAGRTTPPPSAMQQRQGRQAGPAIIPIFKVMVPKPLPTKILK
jgi:hypothetical protein